LSPYSSAIERKDSFDESAFRKLRSCPGRCQLSGNV
jgi:hypothetical protein